jgi:hypothetical protein
MDGNNEISTKIRKTQNLLLHRFNPKNLPFLASFASLRETPLILVLPLALLATKRGN